MLNIRGEQKPILKGLQLSNIAHWAPFLFKEGEHINVTTYFVPLKIKSKQAENKTIGRH